MAGGVEGAGFESRSCFILFTLVPLFFASHGFFTSERHRKCRAKPNSRVAPGDAMHS